MERPTDFVFLGSAHCFHTIDWYKSASSFQKGRMLFVTDSIASQGFPCLVDDTDNLIKLLLIDGLLPRKQTEFGDKWRNFIKLILAPYQSLLLRRQNKVLGGPVFCAHSTYYAFLAALAGIKYVSTPQGSEVLVRPHRSMFYRWFLGFAHASALLVTVDSDAMRKDLKSLFDLDSVVVQNGIDIEAINKMSYEEPDKRYLITSVRGISPIYRIKEILEERNRNLENQGIHFSYPFINHDYYSRIKKLSCDRDVWLGSLARNEFYKQLFQTKLVVSIPWSDSSPRSVYEAIFCGCIVVAEQNDYLSALPKCMRSRVIVFKEKDGWLRTSIEQSEVVLSKKFCPTEDALEMFDQKTSFHRMVLALEKA